MKKIMMVCLGNICRSPLAEGVLKHKLKQSGIDIHVASSGTANYHVGETADPRMITTARRHGIDISAHRGSQFSVNDFDRYDKIYVMDGSNYKNVIRLARHDDDRAKVQLIMDVLDPETGYDVPDPYYSGDDGFELVYNMLDQACDQIVKNIETKKQ
jgi:protein-tyrosine phosphatase